MSYKDQTQQSLYLQAWRVRHPEKVARYRRIYKERHHEERRQIDNARRRERLVFDEAFRIRRYQEKARYYTNHPDMSQAGHRRYKARKLAVLVNDLTGEQWQEIKAAYGFRCVYCGRKMQRLTMDHITPIVQGGNHTASNIVPACQSCNSKKHTRGVLCSIQPLLLTVAPSRQVP